MGHHDSDPMLNTRVFDDILSPSNAAIYSLKLNLQEILFVNERMVEGIIIIGIIIWIIVWIIRKIMDQFI